MSTKTSLISRGLRRVKIHPALVVAGVSTVAVLLLACGGDDGVDAVAPAATQQPPALTPTARVAAESPEAVAVEGSRTFVASTPATVAGATEAPEATSAPELDIAPGINGSTPSAHEVSLAQAPDQLTTVQVVKLLTPSVVHVGTEFLRMGMFNEPVPEQGVGTGIIIDETGLILTNNHVIAGAQRITVTLNTGKGFMARVVGRDPSSDLAVLQIDAPGLSPAALGDSSALEVGEDVIAIGHALGLRGGPTVSKGVVSALGRAIDVDVQNTIVGLIQTDASINPGNSGGPLVNNAAEVIGMNTAIIESGRGIGFAININDAKLVAEQLRTQGFVERAFLGITPFNLTPALANRFGIPVSEGILIQRAIPGTGAGEIGLLKGDVIVQLGDTPIRNAGELSRFLLNHSAGETLTIVYYRGTSKVTTEIVLGMRPPP